MDKIFWKQRTWWNSACDDGPIKGSIQEAQGILDTLFSEHGLDAVVFLNSTAWDAVVFLNSTASATVSAAGYPQLTVPLGMDKKGVPQGATFAAGIWPGANSFWSLAIPLNKMCRGGSSPERRLFFQNFPEALEPCSSPQPQNPFDTRNSSDSRSVTPVAIIQLSSPFTVTLFSLYLSKNFLVVYSEHQFCYN